MDFMYFYGELIAVVNFSLEEEMKLTKDPSRLDITGDAADMGITIFRDLITIDSYGNFTPKILQKYNEEKKRYEDKVLKKEKEQNFRKTPSYSYSDDEDDIMNALEGGYGDIYGF